MYSLKSPSRVPDTLPCLANPYKTPLPSPQISIICSHKACTKPVSAPSKGPSIFNEQVFDTSPPLHCPSNHGLHCSNNPLFVQLSTTGHTLREEKNPQNFGRALAATISVTKNSVNLAASLPKITAALVFPSSYSSAD